MEVRFMDPMYNTTRIVDAYTSCIWNDQYIGYGDFELCFPMEVGSLDGIGIDWYASIRESEKYMVVEGIEIQTSVTEGNTLIVTGRSFESFLERRVIQDDVILTGKLQDCIMRLLNSNAIIPENENRTIPGLSFKKVDDPVINDYEIEFELKAGDNLYDAIYVICDSYKLGFKVVPTTNGQMEFQLYNGVDRSYGQNTNPWIVFSPKFENIKETDMIVDVADKKSTINTNIDYKLQHPNDEDTDEVLKLSIGDDIYGFDRREIYSSVSVSIEKVDISQFGRAEDRVNIRDYQSWEPIYFDSAAYKEAHDKWANNVDQARPEYKEDRTEWRQVEKAGSNEPGWQEAHPNENPYTWQLEHIPGDSAADRAKKDAYYNSILEKEPRESSFYRYGWVLTDPAGYAEALANAQAEIDAEFNAAVADKVENAKKTALEKLDSELAKHLSITNFHGEVDSNVQYLFGRDYYLGDIIQFVNAFYFQATTRLTGITFSQDPSTGFIIQPTFTSDDEAVFEV